MFMFRRGNTSGPEPAVYTHLRDKQHSFIDNNVHILGVREAIHGKVPFSQKR